MKRQRSSYVRRGRTIFVVERKNGAPLWSICLRRKLGRDKKKNVKPDRLSSRAHRLYMYFSTYTRMRMHLIQVHTSLLYLSFSIDGRRYRDRYHRQREDLTTCHPPSPAFSQRCQTHVHTWREEALTRTRTDQDKQQEEEDEERH